MIDELRANFKLRATLLVSSVYARERAERFLETVEIFIQIRAGIFGRYSPRKLFATSLGRLAHRIYKQRCCGIRFALGIIGCKVLEMENLRLPEVENHHARQIDSVLPYTTKQDLFREPLFEVLQFRQRMNRLCVIASLGHYKEVVKLFHFAIRNLTVGQVQFFGLPKIMATFTLAIFQRIHIFSNRRVATEFRVASETRMFKGIIKQISRNSRKNRRCRFELYIFKITGNIVINILDDFENLTA